MGVVAARLIIVCVGHGTALLVNAHTGYPQFDVVSPRYRRRAVYLREPGSTEISEEIRAIILDPANTEMTAETEALLYVAARAQLVKQVIRPALDAGKTIICDRYRCERIQEFRFLHGQGVRS